MVKFRYHSEPSEPELKMKVILDKLGVQYEYQLPVRSGFVLDFAFRDKMKAIEVDGYYHQFSGPSDEFRDSILKRAGWTILRIKTEELDTPSIIGRIQAWLGKAG